MAPDDDDKATSPLDPKVKELLERDQGKSLEEIVDEKTAAELQRWFGLPSFEKLQDEGKAPEVSEEDAADAAKRAETLAAVTEWMLSGLDHRQYHAWSLIKFKPVIDVIVDVDMPMFEESGLDRLRANAEVRELERPEDIEDELKDQTPQALLRDLHRSVTSFEKQYEIQELPPQLVIDIVREVREAMATNWKLPELGDPPGIALRKIFAQLHANLRLPWQDLPRTVEMPNRRVVD